MALSGEDIGKIVELFTSLEKRIDALGAAMHVRFDEVQSHLDGLYRRDEKREQEYLAVQEQMSRLEKRVSNLEQKVA